MSISLSRISGLPQNSITCILPSWISSKTEGNRLVPPAPRQWWHGYKPNFISKQNHQTDHHQQQRNDVMNSVITKTKLSSKPKKISTNMEISEAFKKLGNLHQACPLLPSDAWKGYCFRVVAGRISRLDFPISYDTLQRVSKIKGIGDSSLQMICQYLDFGTIHRIDEFESDPRRIAIKTIKNIWGIGRVKVSCGYAWCDANLLYWIVFTVPLPCFLSFRHRNLSIKVSRICRTFTTELKAKHYH